MAYRPDPKQEGGLKSEVSPMMLLIVVGVLVVAIGGFVLFKSMRGPKFLTGNKAAAGSEADKSSHLHKDEVTGQETTKD